jgi:hypothetical protein
MATVYFDFGHDRRVALKVLKLDFGVFAHGNVRRAADRCQRVFSTPSSVRRVPSPLYLLAASCGADPSSAWNRG